MTAEHAERVVFGSFGGFAGSFQEHTMTPDGSTFSQLKHQGEVVGGQKVNKKIVDQALLVLHQLNDEGYEISDNGNMTYYLKLYKDGEESVEWVWGGNNIKPDSRLTIMYKTLSNFCKASHAPLR